MQHLKIKKRKKEKQQQTNKKSTAIWKNEAKGLTRGTPFLLQSLPTDNRKSG